MTFSPPIHLIQPITITFKIGKSLLLYAQLSRTTVAELY